MDKDQQVTTQEPENKESSNEDNLLDRIMQYTTNQDVLPEEPEEVNPEETKTEESKLEENPEDKSTEKPAEKPTESSTENAEKKDAPYTLDELIELGKSEDFSKINTARIPPELQAVTKSLEAMATRRQQSIAAKEKQLDELLTRANQQPQASNQPQQQPNLDQVALMNPGAALQEIQNQMNDVDGKLKEAETKEDFFEIQKLLLREKELRDKERQIGWHFQNVQAEWNEVRRAIPDINDKAKKIVDWANTALGEDAFTLQEIDAITNPGMMGKAATKTIKLFNKLYEQAQQFETLKKSVEEKLNKTPPPPSEKPGSGKPATSKSNANDLRKKAEETKDLEDWASYIGEMTKKE